MKIQSGATPLIALEAVAADTETTGLDTATARMVQIGAVGISGGRVRPHDSFACFVDPKAPIPASSTAVHQIDAAMVAGAPEFPEALRRLDAFMAGRVLIGFSIGFDLAVIEHEARRAGIRWTKPRTLCVRLLAAVASPHLPDQSLDMIARWLGVSIEGRHQAPGDARAAADIFVALLPKLAERGIRTLAEAERACLAQTAQIDSGHRAGWSEPVTRPEAPGPRAFGSVDPFAYRHRIRDLMASPPAIVPDGLDLAGAIDRMVARRISSLFVADPAEPGQTLSAYGIVTERDVMRRIAARGAEALADPVGSIATRGLASIRADAFVYRAVGRMDRLKIRHLAVRDDLGRLVGVVSARDLLRLRAGAAVSLDDEIEAAADPSALAAAWSTLPAVAEALIEEAIEARTIAEIVSEELRIVTRRAAQMAEADLAERGMGGAPCAYAVMVLGSGGRGESLLAADQDNAIVFAEGAPDGPEDRWFAALGETMAAILDQAGIPFCKGGVMAKNPAFRGSTALWLDRISGWVTRSRPEDLLNVDIFFDLAPVHGDFALASGLFDAAYELGSSSPVFAKQLGERIAIGAAPFTLFGGFRAEEGRVDLKLHGLFPIVAFARALAIRHDIRARSTKARLAGLIDKDLGSTGDLQRLIEAHGTVLKAMLAQQSRDLLAGIPVSNRVEVGALSRDDQAELKAALKAIQVVPDLLRTLMFS
jgi:CBS domain-containing protein